MQAMLRNKSKWPTLLQYDIVFPEEKKKKRELLNKIYY